MRRKIVRGRLGWVKEESIKKDKNVKIKNATKVEVNGVHFRSKLEAYTYKRLLEEGFNVKYEEETFVLQEAFEYNGEKIRPITYTPDFTHDDFILECKGFGNDLWSMKCKMFKKVLHQTGDKRKFFVAKNQKEVNECITKIHKYYEKLKSENKDNNSNTSDLKFLYWDDACM
jgi:hypothetical protein